jgi:hypothetical protein
MAKTWVLDTGTKGTGASVVPLERTQQPPPRRADELAVVPLKRAPMRRPEPAPRRRRQFKITDVMTRETLAEDVDARTALQVLRGVRHNADVHVYVDDPGSGSWRLLSLNEQRALWDARDQVTEGTSPSSRSARRP